MIRVSNRGGFAPKPVVSGNFDPINDHPNVGQVHVNVDHAANETRVNRIVITARPDVIIPREANSVNTSGYRGNRWQWAHLGPGGHDRINRAHA